ncbi:NUDIX hydrolase [Sporanaerobium hydrogeniformans]|uniref:NUDIX hydrolase n=1 Tax=Sporanaerobium hydrogeniformans TaxID=3072179 RepID=A0AC61DGX9_9FIRM|nr:NUDIX hydrolase [Sporanaerobium hydrogeniformans]PHV72243.1 NUDIX hydrolase [Sporanaerobium hydrogeniformans]
MDFKQEIKNYIAKNEQEKNDQRLILDYIKQFPNTILKRENEWAHLTSSGFIMNPALDKVLMAHHNIYKSWAWTGGHADGEADLLAVALREAREETGIKIVRPLVKEIASLDILPVWGHMKKGSYVSTHLHLSVAYILIAEENQLLQMNEAENSGVRWLGVSELSVYCKEPQILPIYEKLIKRARDYKEPFSLEQEK